MEVGPVFVLVAKPADRRQHFRVAFRCAPIQADEPRPLDHLEIFESGPGSQTLAGGLH
jgi:hypothetical protein